MTSAHGARLTHATVSAGLPRVPGGADAHEGADQVLAGHALAGAVVQSGVALVVVWETNDTWGVSEDSRSLRRAHAAGSPAPRSRSLAALFAAAV